MSMTKVEKIEWKIKESGRLIPKLHVSPVYLPGRQNKVKTIHAYNAWWCLDKCVGVGASVFLADDLGNGAAYIKAVNFPMVPDVPQFCLCGIMFKLRGRHLVCMNETCEFKGNGVIMLDVPIHWVNAKIKFT